MFSMPVFNDDVTVSRSLSPRHGAISGCGWRNGLHYGTLVKVKVTLEKATKGQCENRVIALLFL